VLAGAVILSVLGATGVSGQAAQAASLSDPSDLIINMGTNASQLNFSWYCDDTVSGTPRVKVAGIATPFAGVQAAAETGKKSNKVTVTGLAANTTYSFQASSDGANYGPVYTVKTGGANSFTFAAVGDPQIGGSGNTASDAAAWKNTVADITGAGASFIAGMGDQVDDVAQGAAGIAAKQSQYTSFTDGLNQNGRFMPYAVTKGNHEADNTLVNGLSPQMFGYHYNIVNDSNTIVSGVALKDYYYLYNDVLFVVLDTTAAPANATAATPYISAFGHELATATAACAGKYDWLVVQTHKSQQSEAIHSNDPGINAYSLAGFEDLMTEYDVDLVLTGHDHCYTRSYPFTSTGGPLVSGGVTIDENNKGNDLVNPVGTVYMVLNSGSGSKCYDIQEKKATTAVDSQTKNPQYSLVGVTANKLTITTKETGTGTLVDVFSIENEGEQPYAITPNKTEKDVPEQSYLGINYNYPDGPSCTFATTSKETNLVSGSDNAFDISLTAEGNNLTPTPGPVFTVLTLDITSSLRMDMGGQTRLTQLVEATKQFVQAYFINKDGSYNTTHYLSMTMFRGYWAEFRLGLDGIINKGDPLGWASVDAQGNLLDSNGDQMGLTVADLLGIIEHLDNPDIVGTNSPNGAGEFLIPDYDFDTGRTGYNIGTPGMGYGAADASYRRDSTNIQASLYGTITMLDDSKNVAVPGNLPQSYYSYNAVLMTDGLTNIAYVDKANTWAQVLSFDSGSPLSGAPSAGDTAEGVAAAQKAAQILKGGSTDGSIVPAVYAILFGDDSVDAETMLQNDIATSSDMFFHPADQVGAGAEAFLAAHAGIEEHSTVIPTIDAGSVITDVIPGDFALTSIKTSIANPDAPYTALSLGDFTTLPLNAVTTATGESLTVTKNADGDYVVTWMIPQSLAAGSTAKLNITVEAPPTCEDGTQLYTGPDAVKVDGHWVRDSNRSATFSYTNLTNSGDNWVVNYPKPQIHVPTYPIIVHFVDDNNHTHVLHISEDYFVTAQNYKNFDTTSVTRTDDSQHLTYDLVDSLTGKTYTYTGKYSLDGGTTILEGTPGNVPAGTDITLYFSTTYVVTEKFHDTEGNVIDDDNWGDLVHDDLPAGYVFNPLDDPEGKELPPPAIKNYTYIGYKRGDDSSPLIYGDPPAPLIDGIDDDATIIYVYEKSSAYDFVFYKRATNEDPLIGVQFKLTPQNAAKDDWDTSGAVTAQSAAPDGKVSFEGLEAGATYLLQETKTLPGYALPAGCWILSVDNTTGEVSITAQGSPMAFSHDSDDNLVLYNYPSWAAPFTGRNFGVLLFVVAGVVLVGLALYFSPLFRRRGRHAKGAAGGTTGA